MNRVALYSHDSQGLGHVRRSLALATGLGAADPTTQTLLLTGAEEAGALPRPPGCDIVGVPSLHKSSDGRYAARRLTMPLRSLLDLRGAVMSAALRSFAPDVVVVDRHPRGFGGELQAALTALPPTTRVVLGLRDVLDDPEVAAAEWAAHGATDALDRWYDEIWVYGDPRVFDCIDALGLPDRWRERVRYTGYLVPPVPARDTATAEGPVLCLVGGGSDGRLVAEAFARSAWPEGSGLLVLGPQMSASDRDAVRAAAGRRPDLEVRDFESDLTPQLSGARAAVSMGGYNTVCELLAHRVPSLVVPRTAPRREQVVRADRMAELGLLDVLHPGAVTPGRLTGWLRTTHRRPARDAASMVDLDGLARVPRLVRDLVAAPGVREVAHASA